MIDVMYGSFSSMPPVRMSAVVFPGFEQVPHLQHREVLDPDRVMHVDRPRHAEHVDARLRVDRGRGSWRLSGRLDERRQGCEE